MSYTRNRRAARHTGVRRTLLTAMAALLLVVMAVGGTIAWLTDKTDPVVNTFSPSTINIELDESDGLDLKMVPGKTLTKDPFITVKVGSESCIVFVKITKSDNYDTYLNEYTVDAATWTKLDSASSGNVAVYYTTNAINALSADVTKDILAPESVTVKTGVTKTQMESLTDATRPTLSFEAYAIQSEYLGSMTVAQMWEQAQTAVVD